MKIFLTFIVLVFSVYFLRAQDTTGYEKISKRRMPQQGFFWEYGIDNNNWSALNQVLAANGFNGNFNSVSYSRFGLGVLVNLHKKIDIEFNLEGSDQSFSASNKNYNCSFAGIKLLGLYKFYNQRHVIASITSGLNFQMMYLEIDTLSNYTQFVNYNSSLLTKYFLHIPLGLDIKYRFGKKHKIKEKKTSGAFIGLHAAYNINLYQSNWKQNDHVLTYPNIPNPGYFEVGIPFGIY